jgi:tetratricopeptide (TPR) repeat protein
MGIQSEEGLTEAYRYLEAGDPGHAKVILAEILEYDLDNHEVNFAIWCCSFWADFIRQLGSLDPFERSESLISQWKSFRSALAREKKPGEHTVYAVQKGIFTLALENYRSLGDERDPVQKAEIYRKTGLCHKKLGAYETALNCLTEANRLISGSAAVLAEMADCYALCGEEKKAKVLFREAFFTDAERIDLAFLDSELICCLIRQVQLKGYTGATLQEWISVYGILYGIFNVKRELRSQEVGRLKQDIYALENELKDPSSDAEILTPRLINRYFWLIDHYVMTNDNSGKINEILLKIKILDPAIYALYVK